MANMGIGIGAFMKGLQTGVDAVDGWKRSAQQSELNDLRIKQAKTEAADAESLRAASTAAYDDANTARTSAIESSVFEGFRPGEKGVASWEIDGKTYSTEQDARAAAEKKAGSFTDFYMKHGAPKVIEGYLKAGQADKAQIFQTWLDDTDVKKGVRSFNGAVDAARRNDPDAFAKHMRDAYNNKGYMGASGEIAGAKTLTDDKGQTIGMELVYKGADGKETKQTFNGLEDLYRMGLHFMKPEAVMEFGLKEVTAANDARVSLAKADVDDRRTEARQDRLDARSQQRQLTAHELILQRQENAARLATSKAQAKDNTLTPKQYNTELGKVMKEMAAADFAFGRLPGDEQLEQATAVLDARLEVAQARTGKAALPTRQGAAPAASTSQAPRWTPN